MCPASPAVVTLVLTQRDNHLTVGDMGVIRASGLSGYRDLVGGLGGDADQLLRLSGVRPDDAGNHDVFISYRSLVVAVESGAIATGQADFGLQLATKQGIEILGPVGVAARTAPTMGDALGVFTTYLSAYSPSIEVALDPEPGPDRVFFEFRVVASGIPSHPQTTELSLGIALDVFRFLRGDDYTPLELHLSHAGLSDEETYREFFGCPVRFEQRRSGFVMRQTDLARPLAGDSQANEVLVRYLKGLVASSEAGTAPPTRKLVRQLLPTGAVTLKLVSWQLALHPKTLQRRLAEEGTTFAEIVEEQRRELAEHYLRDTDLGLTQIARELGYAEQSVLSRSCQRWFGVGPSRRREQLRSVAPASARRISVRS